MMWKIAAQLLEWGLIARMPTSAELADAGVL